MSRPVYKQLQNFKIDWKWQGCSWYILHIWHSAARYRGNDPLQTEHLRQFYSSWNILKKKKCFWLNNQNYNRLPIGFLIKYKGINLCQYFQIFARVHSLQWRVLLRLLSLYILEFSATFLTVYFFIILFLEGCYGIPSSPYHISWAEHSTKTETQRIYLQTCQVACIMWEILHFEEFFLYIYIKI